MSLEIWVIVLYLGSVFYACIQSNCLVGLQWLGRLRFVAA